MTSDFSSLNEKLNELNVAVESLKELKNEYAIIRDRFILKNDVNERKLQRLLALKEQSQYLKDVLLKDLYKNSISAEKRKITFNHGMKEFQKKKEKTKVQLENLPGNSQLQELIQLNEKLSCEELKWQEIFGNVRKDYVKVVSELESDIKKKVVKFSKNLVELKIHEMVSP